MKPLLTLFTLLLLIPGFTKAQTSLDTLSLKSIFYEPLLAGNRPDLNTFSPDGQHIYYQANDSAMTEEEIFQVSLNGSDRKLAPKDIEKRFKVAPTGNKLLFNKRGDLWIADLNFENKKQLTDSEVPEYNAIWSPNGRRIAFVMDGDVWILDIKSAQLKQVTNISKDDLRYSITDWAGNDKLILSQYDTSDYEEYYFPEYVGHYVETGATRRGIAKRTYSIAYLDSSKIDQILEKKGYISPSVSSDGQYLALDIMDAPMKHREIKVYDLQKSAWETVFKDSTDGWLYGTEMEFAPEGQTLMFQSEKDGWNHIYTINPDGSNLSQHTKGSFEIPWVQWTGKESMVFASTKVDPGERHIYTLDIGNSKVTKLTDKTGYRKGFRLSPDKDHLVYKYSYFNQPFELYSLDLQNPQEEVRLSETIPNRFNKIDWQKEDYIRFTGRDGETKLSMSVLEPLNKQKGSSHPVVVFVHGAGSLQNVYKGWSSSYYREYMFHQYLTAQGYYVIEVDYRHSTGYGREFREDVTNWMGKYETQDIIDGINYLADNYPQADTSKTGIYGGSYGGFMALYATSVAPDYFDAAAALRAVTNWDNYYHTNPWYTLPRLGEPKADSANYARSSPINYVDELEQPVLILHGLIDSNVGFQDAAQYIDKLVQSGDKEFDMMVYPSERHSFKDPDAWYDEYSRIYEFFEEELK
ncbi:S9 family peptidase [Fodinibius halophilus]|uniref:S9 family peptidase n=1 Tax=Fodinibius halophilus TaxID=1736908 RepID=A0A6M1TFR3_9BACT|nr:prolyl oligopeptidase family serine peptidase [Fodinibius halophilus]NGP87480.1 S9 family peptidase [Fodinibius halophilus]